MDVRKSFLLGASILMLTACGPHMTKEEVIDYGEIGYSDIISYIVVGYQTNWEDMDPKEMNLSPVYTYSSKYAGFTKKDIDSDGFDELLIGDQFEDGSYALYDIYCFNKKNASLIHLASGGERDTFNVTLSGVIVETGSNSAEDSFTKGYRIHKDKLEEISGGWDRSLMPVQFERFSDLAKLQQLCGGYTDQREPTDEEIDIFRSVIGGREVVYTPLSVSTQVVAGINYRFYCRYEDISDGIQRKDADDDVKYGYCWITIFKPLPGRGEPTLTSIEKVR